MNTIFWTLWLLVMNFGFTNTTQKPRHSCHNGDIQHLYDKKTKNNQNNKKHISCLWMSKLCWHFLCLTWGSSPSNSWWSCMVQETIPVGFESFTIISWQLTISIFAFEPVFLGQTQISCCMTGSFVKITPSVLALLQFENVLKETGFCIKW